MTKLQVTQLDAGFGVRVRGAALQYLPAEPAAVDELRSLIARHRVVVLPNLHMDAQELVALAGTLGEVRTARVRHPSLMSPAAEHIFVSARDATSCPMTQTPADAAHMWHVDYSVSASVPQLSMLFAVKAPVNGSRTGFADMAVVYAALPQVLREQIAELQARHYRHPQGVDITLASRATQMPWDQREQGVAHPLVMRDVGNVPFLFLPAHSDSPVVGLDESQSRALMDQLWSHVEPHGRPWEHEQASGELMIWDNRTLLHKRSEWPLNEERLLWFLTTN